MVYDRFASVRTAQVVLFALSWVVTLLFIFLMFKPFQENTANEARQVRGSSCLDLGWRDRGRVVEGRSIVVWLY